MTEALCKAAMRGDEETVRKLLEEGLDPRALCRKGVSAVHIAAKEGHAEVLKLLLDSPAADVNAPDDSGFPTLLHAVCGCQGDPTTVRLVLGAPGCNAAATDEEGNNALHWAAKLGQTEVAALLLNRGVPKDAPNAAGDSPLHAALKEGNEETALLLLQRGADINAKDAMGATPLHLAVSSRLLPVAVEMLNSKRLTRGGCIDTGGNTPMHIAAEEGLLSFMKVLEDAGFSQDVPNFAGMTPAAIVEMRKQQREEDEQKRSAALQEKGLRKRQQAAAALQQTPVTAFCVAAGFPELIQEAFFKKKFIYVDEAFLTLDDAALRKIGLSAPDRLFFKEAVQKYLREQKEQEEKELAQLQSSTNRQMWMTRIFACIILIGCVALLYLGLELLIKRQQQR